MKKITFLFSTFFIILLHFYSLTVHASETEKKTEQYWIGWNQQAYSPDLYVYPYLNLTQKQFLTDPFCLTQTIPFWEGFNKDSPTLTCWTIVDNNKDSTSPNGNNIWKVNNYLSFEGDQFMYFNGGPKNDDWLISPTFKLEASKTYKLTYQYKANTYNNNEFEVLASNKGLLVTDFKTVIVDKRIYTNDTWREQQVYITNLAGDVNLAWHVTTSNYTNVSIDAVNLKEVECIEPEKLDVKNVKTDQVTLFWDDKLNTSWEYFIDESNGFGPLGSGIIASSNEVTADKDHNNNKLIASTKYDYYVRAKCSSGNFGDWIGPFSFITACNAITPPYSEGFNTSSKTISCWTLIDNNKDRLPSGDNAWRTYNSMPYEGDRLMYFQSYVASAVHDDWLISPSIKMNGGLYAISYYYKTTSSFDNDFEVLLSTHGTAPNDFKTVLESATKRNTTNYIKKTIYVKDVVGDVNIAWHVMAKGFAVVSIDLVTIDKVDCIAPEQTLTITDIEKDKAKLSWVDTNNTNWEYYVQPLGSGSIPVGSGNLANQTKVTISKTGNKFALPNTV